MQKLEKIGLGGGCHWCTEALYLSVRGVDKVEQGYIAPQSESTAYSEAVIVHYNPGKISLETLIEIHLYTHSSTSVHKMRTKYRSAVYAYSNLQFYEASGIIASLQSNFGNSLVTGVLPFGHFKASDQKFRNYYYSNPEKPFCEHYIGPKLQVLLSRFSRVALTEKITRG